MKKLLERLVVAAYRKDRVSASGRQFVILIMRKIGESQ